MELYGCEAWTIGKEERRRLKAFEMWWKSSVNKLTNEGVLNLVNENRSLYASRKSRRDGLALGHKGLAETILKGFSVCFS